MKKIFRWLFYAPRHDKPTDQNILSLILPSILGICLCMVCLVGLTVAWYTVNVESATQKLTTPSGSNLTFAVTESQNETAQNSVDTLSLSKDGNSYTFNATAGSTYTLSVKNEGSGHGYAVISIAGKDSVYTTVLDGTAKGNSTYSFDITVDADTTVTVTPQWGYYSAEGKTVLSNQGVLTLTGGTLYVAN